MLTSFSQKTTPPQAHQKAAWLRGEFGLCSQASISASQACLMCIFLKERLTKKQSAPKVIQLNLTHQLPALSSTGGHHGHTPNHHSEPWSSVIPNHETAYPGHTPDAGGTEQRPPVADGLPVTARRHLLSLCPTLPCRSRSTGVSAETLVKISKKDILNVAKTPRKCTDHCP